MAEPQTVPDRLPANFDFSKQVTLPDRLPANFDFGAQPTPKPTNPTADALAHQGFLESAWNMLKAVPAGALEMVTPHSRSEKMAQMNKALDLADKYIHGSEEEKAAARDEMVSAVPGGAQFIKAREGNWGGLAGDVAGALLVGGATKGLGDASGAIRELPGAVKATALQREILGTPAPSTAAGSVAGGVAGGAAGHSVGGWPGAAVGAAIGKKVGASTQAAVAEFLDAVKLARIRAEVEAKGNPPRQPLWSGSPEPAAATAPEFQPITPAQFPQRPIRPQALPPQPPRQPLWNGSPGPGPAASTDFEPIRPESFPQRRIRPGTGTPESPASPQAAAPQVQTVAPAPPALLDELAQSLAGKTFDRLSPTQKTAVRGIADKVSATQGATPAQAVAPTPQPANLQAALLEEMQRNGYVNPTLPQPAAAVPQGKLDAGMRAMPKEMRQPMADANYRQAAAGGEGAPAGQVYEAAARGDKLEAFTNAFKEHAVGHDIVSQMGRKDWAELARSLGVRSPSQTTIDQIIAQLKLND